MGKKQHQKDKMYITHTEWSTLYGGKRPGLPSTEDILFRRVPFDHCCLSFNPYHNPYCDKDGNIFELQAIIEFVKKFKINPVTGKKLDIKSLVKLNFHKNANGEYHCPVLFKLFTKNSHIVAISKSGNVFSYEAVEQLNIKGKNWKDLISDEAFERGDIITLQDPNNLDKFNMSTFHHIKNKLRVETEDEIAEKKDPNARLKKMSAETKDILEQLERDYKAPEVQTTSKVSADKFNAAHYSTGAVAASFTSTVMETVTHHEPAIIHEDEVRYERVKKKGYVRMITNLGPLNLEIYCDVVPKTGENFIKHCANGYYNGLKFHRSIRNFMVQGGDPTGTGLGGESIWRKKFEDEIKPNLHHAGRGILSMANSGPNSSGSQFFITYRSCKHLDGKHTIFGKLVGGLDTLTTIERVEVDNKDRPIEHIIIKATQVFVDPYQEVDEQLVKEREEDLKQRMEEEAKKNAPTTSKVERRIFRKGVGKYLNLETNKTKSNETEAEGPAAKKKKDASYHFNNFNSW